MNKGQLSIEFILLVMIGLYLLQAFFLPILNDADTAFKDVYNYGKIYSSTKRLSETIDLLSSSNDARMILELFFPEDSNITCSPADKSLNFQLKTKGSFYKCPGNVCSKDFNLSKDISLQECSLRGFGLTTVQVRNLDGSITLTVI